MTAALPTASPVRRKRGARNTSVVPREPGGQAQVGALRWGQQPLCSTSPFPEQGVEAEAKRSRKCFFLFSCVQHATRGESVYMALPAASACPQGPVGGDKRQLWDSVPSDAWEALTLIAGSAVPQH